MRDLSDRELERMFQLDDGPGPARPADDARFAAIIAGALSGAGFPSAATGAASGGAPGAGHAAAGAAKSIAVTKLGVLAGGLAAVALAGWAVLRSPNEAPSPRRPAPIAAVAAPDSGPPALDPQIEMAPPEPAPPAAVVDEPPPGVSEPRTIPRPPKIAKPATSRHPTAGSGPRSTGEAGRVATPHLAPLDQSHARPAALAMAPEDLLAAANAARASHRWREADALYTRVVSAAHAELAVQAALIASASLHLEHLGDPAGAVRRFRDALAAGPRDALAEDARWGIAEATRATGDADREAAALDEFLSYHAGSPRAVRARARRAELGGPR